MKMKYLRITSFRKSLSFPISCRCISTELWKNELDENIRKEIENHWKKQFKYDNLFDQNNSKEKFYVLSMFPYPSGNLHMGHVRVYTISDVIARFFRMNGKNVLQPMGWDAFGLPAENAAFERGITPDEWTKKNISQMKTELKKLSCTFDWKYELATCDPNYYRWTQYIFLKMYEAGLVYRKEALVNWDPVDETVLANEQIDEEGRSWRSGTKVEKRILKQWFIRTTKFAENLYKGLNDPSLVNWDDIIAIQKHWIGECNGYSFEFKFDVLDDTRSLNVWVQDALSILNVEFIVVKPNSMADVMSNNGSGERQLEFNVINPFTNHLIPIFVSENVNYPIGRDVYVGVPSKVETDKEFAINKGIKHNSYSYDYNAETICEKAQKMGIGGYPVSSKLEDWLISRQRYWGTPIPMVHCKKCGSQPVPFDELPVTLPPLPKNFKINKGLNNFLKNSTWKDTICPKCNGKANRETDTMDTFVDSSWYYLRYIECNNDKEPFSDITNKFLPVDIYIGGKEHAVLHLYYARFMNHFLHSINFVKQREPFQRLLCQGMVRGKTYKDKEGRYYKRDEIEFRGETALNKANNEELIVSWEKMSKSKYNGVEPKDVLDKYGIDATRLFLLFSVAPMSHRNWDSNLFSDVLTWQHRLWLTIKEFLKIRENTLNSVLPGFNLEIENEKLRAARHKWVRMTTYSFKHSHQLAAAITNLQAYTNVLRTANREVRKFSKEYERCLASFIIMLSPLAPHFAATLWYGFTSAPGRLNIDSDEINWNENVTKQKWPKLDQDQILPFIIRLNSYKTKYTSNVTVSFFNNLNLENSLDYALLHPTVRKLVDPKDIRNIKLEIVKDFAAIFRIKIDNERFEENEETVVSKRSK